MSEIHPCPCCGTDEPNIGLNHLKRWQIECRGCQLKCDNSDRAGAIFQWNKRPKDVAIIPRELPPGDFANFGAIIIAGADPYRLWQAVVNLGEHKIKKSPVLNPAIPVSELRKLVKEWKDDSRMYSGKDGLKDAYPMSTREGEEWARAVCADELEALLNKAGGA